MCNSAAIEPAPRVIGKIEIPAATAIRSTLSLARLGLAAALVGAGMLIGSVQPGRAGEIPASPAGVERPAPDAARPARPARPAAAQPADAASPQFFGAVGFGWG